MTAMTHTTGQMPTVAEEVDRLVKRTRAILSTVYKTLPLSAIQQQSLRNPVADNSLLTSQDCFPAPPHEENDARTCLADAIHGLGRTDQSFPTPSNAPVNIEWLAPNRPDPPGPAPHAPALLSERQKYARLTQLHPPTQPTIFYVHGGTYFLHPPPSHLSVASHLSRLTNYRCITVSHRLAPQSPFPSALLDILNAYLTLLYPPPTVHHTPVHVSSLILAGDSSGAAILLALIQVILASTQKNLRFHGHTVTLPLPTSGIAVLSPACDAALALPSWIRNAPWDIFSRSTDPLTDTEFRGDIIWPSNPPRAHVYCDAAMLAHPLVSAAAARDWKKAPPLWIAMGEERLADGAKVVAKTATAQGVVVGWDEYERMPHNWAVMLPPLATSREVLRRWAGAIERMGRGEFRGWGWVRGVEGGFTEVDVRSLIGIGPEEAQELMRRKSAGLEVWAGGKGSQVKL